MTRTATKHDDVHSKIEGSSDYVSNAAPVAVWETNDEGRCTFLSREWYEFTGQKLDAGLDYGWIDAIHASDRIPAREIFAAANRRRERFHLTYRLRRWDGEYRWVIDTGHPRFDDDGRFMGYIGSVIDITEWQRAEERLRANEAKYRAIFENAVEGLFQTTPEGAFLNLNPALARIYGYETPEEVIAHFNDIASQLYVDANRREEFVRLMERHGKVQAFEFAIRRRDGSQAWVSESARAVHGADGKLLWYEGTVEDITERKRAEELMRASEQRYAKLVADLDSIVWEADANTYQFLFVSRQAERILGYPLERWMNDPTFWRDHIHPEDRDYAVNYCVQSTQRGESHDFEYRMIAADGRIVWLHDVVSLEMAGGKPVLLRGVMVDITERKRVEQALRENEAFLRMSQRVAKIGSWQWDLRTNAVRWSDVMYDIYGISPGDFDGTLAGAIRTTHPDDLPGIQTTIEKIMREGKLCPVEYRVFRPNGEIRHLWGEGEVTQAVDGRPVLVTGIVMDVTERKRAEEERRNLEAQILHTQKLESLGVLAGGIAHDFNNLLTAILGFSSLAQSQLPADSGAVPMLREVEKAAQRAADLTRQMLAYSGRGKFVIEVIRLDSLVDEMVGLLGSVISKKAKLQLDLRPASIEGDATQIRQVVMNLITNASDALNGQPGVIQVRTGVRRAEGASLRSRFVPDELPAGNYAYVEVEDDGCGMDEDTLARIFDPFFTTKFTGRGLGLAAALGIVRGHRGVIHVHSRSQAGTCFQVLLPCSDQTARPAAANEPAPHAMKGHGLVLIVEDEPSLRTFTRRVLERSGFQTMDASNGKEGLERFRKCQGQIAAVLLDVTMPHMDGLEMLRELRRLGPEVPVLVMSGYSDAEVTSRFDGTGTSGFIQKPFQPGELIARLCALLPQSSNGVNGDAT